MVASDVTSKAGFDFYNVFDENFNDEQKALQQRLREWVDERVLPNINEYWENAEFPEELFYELNDLGIIGGTVPEYGGAGLDFIESGIVAYELARGDGSIGTAYGVHSGLAIPSIYFCGSDEQKERWLPDMMEMKKIGAFGLTEPFVGSNAAGIRTTAVRDGDDYVLNGAKRWIGNASIADLIVIWGRDEDGKLGAFVLEDPDSIDGLEIEDIQGKVGKRGVLNADIVMNDVRVPAKNRLANVTSFKHTTQVLFNGRFGVAWEAAGCAAGAFEHALEYALDREQFGKPIAGFQLIQRKLVEMATEITTMQTLCMQLARNATKGTITEGMASMAKYNNAKKARRVTQLARETLGGNGILIDNHIARLWTDAEVIYTYEGTNEINLLIVGRELTGHNAITG